MTSMTSSKIPLALCMKKSVTNEPFSRFYPQSKDIVNVVTRVSRQQEVKNWPRNVKTLAEVLSTDNSVFFRPYTGSSLEHPADTDEENEFHEIEESPKEDPMVKQSPNVSCGNMIFVYQSPLMKRLYRMYENHYIFLDATYKTCNNAVPLFFLMVRTNVNYQVVAVFVVQHETRDMIKEALSIIWGWSPHVQPLYGMVDFSEEEIHALEDVFPGNLKPTLLCY